MLVAILYIDQFLDTLLAALVKRKEVVNLTAVSNNAGAGDSGLGTHEVPDCTQNSRLSFLQESYSTPRK